MFFVYIFWRLYFCIFYLHFYSVCANILIDANILGLFRLGMISLLGIISLIGIVFVYIVIINDCVLYFVIITNDWS
jgi:hypothetical protein